MVSRVVEQVYDPLKQLEAYRAQKKGLEEQKPFGIDRHEAIKVMSIVGDRELERQKMNKKHLKKMIEN